MNLPRMLDLQCKGCYILLTLSDFSEALRVSNGSHLPLLSGVVLGTTFVLLSCGSSMGPAQLIVHIPEHYSGAVHIHACMPTAPRNEITVDAQGVGSTALCPGTNTGVELQIVQNGQQYKIADKEVHILRTGDGIATSIEAQVRQ